MVDKSQLRGMDVLHDPSLNKGTAFTEEERDQLGLRGLLPPRTFTQDEQLIRTAENMRSEATDLDKYIFLIGLQERNENLFYRLVLENMDEIMPLIYTPTVGKACQEYGHIFRRAQGLFVSIEDKGRIRELVNNWPEDDVRVIVMTDGERILGLGDQGAQGMGIPVGKLSLYTGCAGVHPSWCLPVTLDVGTNNGKLLDDPLYIGLPRNRATGHEYDEFIDEFITAARERYPDVLIQFEDFANHNAFRLLDKYRNRITTFNDDIQGTASVTLAGLYSALRITGGKLTDQNILFLGAGEAGIGIGDLIVSAMMAEGINKEEAKRRNWFVDSRGLVVASREADLAPHKLAYAHESDGASTLLEAIKMLKPTAIIGVSGRGGMFTQEIVSTMAELNERPIIFALSNPTSNSECTAKQAYSWSSGRAIFASGSPFAPLTYEGQTFVPGQANNSYIFPGLGLGLIASKASSVPDEMFFVAAQTLANMVKDSDLELGRTFPPLTEIREVSAQIAAAVATRAKERGLAQADMPDDILSYIKDMMYDPTY